MLLFLLKFAVDFSLFPFSARIHGPHWVFVNVHMWVGEE